MNQIPAIYIRQGLLMLLIAGIFGVLCWNLSFFVPALLGAYTLYVLLKTPLAFIIDRWNWSNKIASAVLLLLSFIVLMLPFNWMFLMLEGRVIALLQNSDKLRQNAENLIHALETKYAVTLMTPQNMTSVTNWTVNAVQGVVGATVNGLGLLLATYFILWFMLTDGKKMEQSFFNWMPLRHENVTFVRKQLNDMVWGNALGIPLMGLVQGMAGLLIYWLVGVDDPWLWFAVTFVSGMLPILGTMLAYIPLALLLLSQGEEGKALIIFIYGLVVIGSVDNLARMWLLKKISHTHPLITLFGVVVGLQLFGFIGFVFGPILISLFILLLHIYHKEFHQAA